MLLIRLFLGVLLLTMSNTLTAQEIVGPEFSFETNGHNYGVLYVDSMPETKMAIQFTNTGSEPFVVVNVRACCGTKVLEYTKEPIMPGKEGHINIEFFLAPRPQRLSRVVTVTTNIPDNPTHIFRITGEVKERE